MADQLTSVMADIVNNKALGVEKSEVNGIVKIATGQLFIL